MAINISTWRSLKLEDPHQQQIFIDQLVQYLQDTSKSEQNAINTLNNQVAALNTFSLTPNSSQLGNVAVNTTFNCKSSYLSVVTFTMTGSFTLTFSNLPLGAFIIFDVTVGATLQTLKLAATTPSAVAYTGIGLNYAGSPAVTNNLLTGMNFQSGTFWAHGASYGTPAAPLLNFITT